jgi:tetratricopeptide (TPR) repeat protein
MSCFLKQLSIAVCAGLWLFTAPALAAEKPQLSQEEQEALALKIFQDLAKTPEDKLDVFNHFYREVIEKCPDTERAEISYWRLSNLLILGYEPPRCKEAIDLLEKFLARYPASKGVGHVKNRLLRLYEETGDYCNAAKLYKEFVPHIPDPPDSEGLSYWVLYAEALEKCGQKQDARTWYEKVLKATKDPDSMSAMIAKDGLSRLNK